MPLTIDVGVDELAATRFATSPLSETVAGLQVLGADRCEPGLRPWRTWALREVRRSGLALPVAWPLIVTGLQSYPQFLVPSPARPDPTVDEELAHMRSTRAAQVRASLTRVFGTDLPAPVAEVARHPAAQLRLVAEELRAAHDLLVAPHWPRLRAVLVADIGYRGRQLAIGGAARLFADLHPSLSWERGRLTLQGGRERSVALNDRGLVLVPSVLTGDPVRIKLSSSTQTTVRYPARGAAEVWTAGLREPPAGAVRLIGRPRARVLDAVRSPATTGALARSLGVTPSAVSQHLGVLRASGLVTSERAGRSVVHLVTALGSALLDA